MAAQTFDSLKLSTYIMLQVGPANQSGAYDPESDPGFNNLFPQAITYGEGRIYRDVVMLAERLTDTSLTTTVGSRDIDLSSFTQMPLLVVEGVALITPAGVTDPKIGTRTPFVQTQVDWIDQFWPTEATTMAPIDATWIGRYWALENAETLVVAPTPDSPGGQKYTAAITGIFQPEALSAANQTTYLSTIYSELLEAALMMWLSGSELRNFGAQSDDPKMAVSWESVYQGLLPGVILEEQRRRGQGQGWSNQVPTVAAQPART